MCRGVVLLHSQHFAERRLGQLEVARDELGRAELGLDDNVPARVAANATAAAASSRQTLLKN